MPPLSDPEGLKRNKARLTSKLAALTEGTQEHTRVKLHLEGVEKELAQIEAKGLPDAAKGLPAGVPTVTNAASK